jgi:acetoin utilization deacetylase AcuC-like enzyme
LPRLMAEVKPDFVFYLSGVDVLVTDKLGRFAMSRAGCKQRDRIVLETMRKTEIPMAISMGGGYSVQIRDIVEAHCNTFRLAVEIFG